MPMTGATAADHERISADFANYLCEIAEILTPITACITPHRLMTTYHPDYAD